MFATTAVRSAMDSIYGIGLVNTKNSAAKPAKPTIISMAHDSGGTASPKKTMRACSKTKGVYAPSVVGLKRGR